MPPAQEMNGWGKYSLLVMAKLDEHQKLLEGINSELTKIHVEIAMLKVKSGMWGALAGVIPVVIFIIFKSLGSP